MTRGGSKIESSSEDSATEDSKSSSSAPQIPLNSNAHAGDTSVAATKKTGEVYAGPAVRKLARELGVAKLKADVLADNQGMNYVFQKSKIPYERRADFGVNTYIFDLGIEESDDAMVEN